MPEKVEHEWIADGVVHRIVEDFWDRTQIVSTLNGAEILGVPSFRERAFVSEILRLRGLLDEVLKAVCEFDDGERYAPLDGSGRMVDAAGLYDRIRQALHREERRTDE